MSSPTSCRLFFPIPNISRPLSLTYTPDYRRLAVAWLILRSIQRSRIVLRSFQRLPSLNAGISPSVMRSEEHTSELQSLTNLVCRLLLEKKKKIEMIRMLFIQSTNILQTRKAITRFVDFAVD